MFVDFRNLLKQDYQPEYINYLLVDFKDRKKDFLVAKKLKKKKRKAKIEEKKELAKIEEEKKLKLKKKKEC